MISISEIIQEIAGLLKRIATGYPIAHWRRDQYTAIPACEAESKKVLRLSEYEFFYVTDILLMPFAYAEFDSNSPGVKKTETTTQRIWKNAAFLGN